MNTRNPLFNTSKVVLAAAVVSTMLLGCGRRSADQPAASAQTGSSATAGMDKDSSTAAASGASPSAAAGSATTAAAGSTATGSDASGASGATAGGTGASGGMAGNAMTPNDAQIEGIVMTANTSEVDAGRMAESKTQNSKVKEFARDMVKAHTDMNQQVANVAKKSKSSPGESDVSKQLKEDAAKNAANLTSMSGKGFDKAYIDSQVTDHEKVLSMIDTVLMPNAKDAELKALLQKARPDVATHLDHAKTLQASLK